MPVSPCPEDADIPPAVSCAACGRPHCAGCIELPAAAGTIVWEDPGPRGPSRLFRTALATSIDPERTFGELPEGPLAPALGFALLAETLAIGSLALMLVPVAWVMAPRLIEELLESPRALGLGLGLVLLASLLMVGLHALWGLCLELGPVSHQPGPRLGLGVRFGLYACGWDLLTSPAGVLHGIWARGPLGAWKPVAAAARVPRAALRAYLEQRRQLDAHQQRRAAFVSLLVLGSTGLGGAVVLIWAAIWAVGVVLGGA